MQAYAGSRAQAPTVAALLCAGALLGVVRGRTEVGPRALGHRSLLMSAEHADAKRRMNQACLACFSHHGLRSAWLACRPQPSAFAALSFQFRCWEQAKHRQWFRPVAPVVQLDELHLLAAAGSRAEQSPAASASPSVALRCSVQCTPISWSAVRLGLFVCLFALTCSGFAAVGPSPFMSFAPTLSAAAMARFPAAAHLDQSARIQASPQSSSSVVGHKPVACAMGFADGAPSRRPRPSVVCCCCGWFR